MKSGAPFTVFLKNPIQALAVNTAGQLAEWKWAGIDLIAPPSCAGCERTGSPWCRRCQAETILFDSTGCSVCGGPLQEDLCPHCDEHPASYTRAASFAAYRPPFRKALLHLKHRPDESLGALLAELVVPRLRSLGWDLDLAISVPLGPARRAQRGYNQVDLVGRTLSRRVNLPYRPSALQRVRETRSQVGLNGEERAVNLSGAFRADPASVEGRRILLLDDVFTTGSTASAAARALFAAGAVTVNVFTLARAVGAAEEVLDLS